MCFRMLLGEAENTLNVHQISSALYLAKTDENCVGAVLTILLTYGGMEFDS